MVDIIVNVIVNIIVDVIVYIIVDVIVNIIISVIIDIIIDIIVNYIYPIFTKLGWVFNILNLVGLDPPTKPIIISKFCKISIQSFNWLTIESIQRPSHVLGKFIIDIIVNRSIYIKSILHYNFINSFY